MRSTSLVVSLCLFSALSVYGSSDSVTLRSRRTCFQLLTQLLELKSELTLIDLSSADGARALRSKIGEKVKVTLVMKSKGESPSEHFFWEAGEIYDSETGPEPQYSLIAKVVGPDSNEKTEQLTELRTAAMKRGDFEVSGIPMVGSLDYPVIRESVERYEFNRELKLEKNGSGVAQNYYTAERAEASGTLLNVVQEKGFFTLVFQPDGYMYTTTLNVYDGTLVLLEPL